MSSESSGYGSANLTLLDFTNGASSRGLDCARLPAKCQIQAVRRSALALRSSTGRAHDTHEQVLPPVLLGWQQIDTCVQHPLPAGIRSDGIL